MYSLGLDLGSTTVKYVLLDDDGRIVSKDYCRHGAAVYETAVALLQNIAKQYPSTPFFMALAGSASLDVAEGIGAEFEQEVVATSLAIRRLAPETDVAIELGGEDAKIIYLTNGMELRMNEVCAGGTGAFIDQMAALLDTDAAGLNKLAAGFKTLYPIASRCGVFAKTDVVPLLNSGARKEDVAVSILQAVVDQTIGGLACGRPIRGHVAFLGGPLHFLPELKKRFIESLGLTPDNTVHFDDGQYVVAIGAATSAQSDSAPRTKPRNAHTADDWIALIKSHKAGARRKAVLPALFSTAEEYEQFKVSHNTRTTPQINLEDATGDLWLGVDLGSTTVKGVLIDEKKRIAASWYRSNSGDVLNTLVPKVAELLGKIPQGAHIRGVCTTGYGADLAASVLDTPLHEVETIAHLKAASYLYPDTTYVIDIGGQDMKCMQTRDGLIEGIKLNEACSSGCGAFIQTFAKSLGLTLSDFVHKALFAKTPADLGTRCTVFMNSRVKQAQREGAGIGEIAAGLCYSVIRNALYKVLRLKSPKDLGDHVVVQGGAFINDALLRVLEIELKRPVVRPDISGLMGAFGCALIAQEKTSRENVPSPVFSAKSLSELQVTTRSFHCKGCNNRCMLTMSRFSNGKKFISGNRCDFGARGGNKKKERDLWNLYRWKYENLFSGDVLPEENAPRGTIGIPRALNMFEHYPFWRAFFNELGFHVLLSPDSNKSIFNSGLTSMPSQSVCFPAKLAHGHIKWLASHGARKIWFPCVPWEQRQFKESDNTFACPVVAGYPEVTRLNAELPEDEQSQILTPFVLLDDKKVLVRNVLSCFPSIPVKEIEAAYERGKTALEKWREELQKQGELIFTEALAHGKTVVLLAGRPYHCDPYINHGLADYITSLGVAVVSEDSVAHLAPDPGKLRVVNQWAFHARLYRAAALAASEPLVELVQLTNFGCGIDAITTDQIAEMLAPAGKLYTLLKIDEGDSLGPAKIRLASLLAAVSEKKEPSRKVNQHTASLRETEENETVFTRPMRKTRTILAPQMSPIHFPILEAALNASGFQLKLLPEVSQEAINTGLSVVNNDACYPAIITIGQLIHALKSGQYDPEGTALILAQTCGPCRATNYIALLKRALAESGFLKTPVVSFSGSAINVQPGFSLTPLSLRRLVIAMLYGDMLQRLYFATKSHEIFEGDADSLLKKWTTRAREVAARNSAREFEQDMKRMVREFASIAQDDREKPRVGIVGEILLKYHPDANRHIAENIMKEGGEPVMTDIADFFMYCLSDYVLKHKLADGKLSKALVSSFLMNRIDSLRKAMREALAGTPYMPIADFRHLANSVKGIVSLAEQAGEGWLLTAELIDFVRSGVPNVLCLQPFGCLPNHITGKGVIKAVREKFPTSNIMAIDFDAGNSEANVANRIKLFMSIARENSPHQAHTPQACALTSGDQPIRFYPRKKTL